MPDTRPQLAQIRAFLHLCRLHFLVPGFLLYVLGALLAAVYGASPDIERFVWGYLIFLTAHLSMHLSNDYFDQEADSHGSSTAISGGSGILLEHPELGRPAIAISAALMIISLITALFFQLSFTVAWYFLPFVILGNLLGYFYAAPPLRLAYRGLGELSTIVAAGVIMPGMGYLAMNGSSDGDFLVLIPALLAYGVLFIISVEMPDTQGDREGGKVTLLVRYGEERGYIVILLSAITGTLLFATLSIISSSSVLDYRWFVLFSLIPLVTGFFGIRGDLSIRPFLIRQVKVNVASLIFLLLFIDVYFLILI